RLPQPGGELVEDKAMDDVGRAPGADRDDRAQRLGRPSRGVDRGLSGGERKKEQRAFHGFPRKNRSRAHGAAAAAMRPIHNSSANLCRTSIMSGHGPA